MYSQRTCRDNATRDTFSSNWVKLLDSVHSPKSYKSFTLKSKVIEGMIWLAQKLTVLNCES